MRNFRKSGIIPSYYRQSVPGTFESKEFKSVFGSQLVEIPNYIYVESQKINYKTREDGTQTNNDNVNMLINVYDLKNNLHTLIENNNDYVIEIEYKKLLKEFIFHSLKKSRAFKGITSSEVKSGDVNIFVNEYIDDNIISRIDLHKINLFIRKKNKPGLREPVWEPKLNKDDVYGFSLTKESKKVKVAFNVNIEPTECLLYYFDIIYKKI